MAHEFRLPDIGEGLTDAEIIHWFVAEGDSVAVDQAVVEIETAKTTVEITSTHAGTLLSLGGEAGATIAVGDVLFVVGADGEAPPVSNPPAPETDTPAHKPSAGADSMVRTGAADGRVRAMPIVRKLAKERGVDLGTLHGTGPNGAVTRADVESASESDTTAPNLTPLTRTRKAIAKHMTESWTTIPHVTVQADIRAEHLLQARATRTSGAHPIEALVARAAIPVLADFPEFNAALKDDAVEYRDRYDIGFAVDTPEGLLVAVARAADSMTLDELSAEFERLSSAALDGTLAPSEAAGQTFTISNIGALGGGHGTPIIPLGTSAILSIGRAMSQPVVEDGELLVGMVAPLDLSYDHRLIDGGLGQRFLSALTTRLETDVLA